MKEIIENFDLIEYLDSTGVEYDTEGDNIGKGWIGISCVFCNDHEKHLGVNLHHKGFNCWLCEETGTIIKLLMTLEDFSFGDAKATLDRFATSIYKTDTAPGKRKRIHTANIIPNEFREIKKGAEPKLVRQYFKRRKLPLDICHTYHLGWCRVGDYALQLIVPVFYRRVVVSFMAVDLTGEGRIPYRICPNDIAWVPKDDLVYGLDDLKKSQDQIVITEGLTDKWAVGKKAVAIFGKRYTSAKLSAIAKRVHPKTIIKTLLDADAADKNEELSRELQVFFSNIIAIYIEREKDDAKDPAEMSRSQIQKILTCHL